MRTIIRYVLLTALRDRLFLVLILGLLIGAGLSHFLAKTSMIEIDQMRIVLAAGVTRIIVVLGMVVFVAFHIRHAFETREIDVILSRPISRVALVQAFWTGFVGVGTLLVAAGALIVFLSGTQEAGPGFFLWAGSLLLEVWLVTAIALFASLIMRSAVASVLVCLGFYVFARMAGYFLLTMQSRLLFQEAINNIIAKGAVRGLAIFIPRLDFYADTSWLVYEVENVVHTAQLFLLQSAVYIPVLLLAAIIDFRRKQF